MKIVLFVPYYIENNINRKREIDMCIATNIANPLISKIVLVADESVSRVEMPFEKVVVHYLGHRAMFSDIFYDVCPKYVQADDIQIISNTDIYFDNSLSKLYDIDWDKGIALSCSRWDRACNMASLMPDELKESKEYVVYPQWDSQDFWVFKGAIKPMFSSFYFGNPGGDNRLTYEMDKAGYWVFNPAKEIKGFHVHDSNIRTYVSKGKRIVESVPEPYKLLYATDLGNVKLKAKKKLFHCGMYAYDLDEYLCDYRFIDWRKYCRNFVLIPEKKKEFEDTILKGAEWADVVYLQLQTPNIISKELADKISNLAKVYQFIGDVRDPIPSEIIEIAPYVHTLMSNDTDNKKLRELGFKADFVNIGFPENVFHPKGHVRKYVPDIVFMSNNYYSKDKHTFPLGKARQDMVLFLKEIYGDNFGLYGNGWHGLENESLNGDHEAEAATYRGCNIGINYSHFDYERYSSDRILRIMGSGCFCLSHKYQRIEEDFEIGKHLDVFNNFDELKKKIDYYLLHADERRKIAEQGCKLVHERDTWTNRISQILNT